MIIEDSTGKWESESDRELAQWLRDEYLGSEDN